jgi:heme exporter protein A
LSLLKLQNVTLVRGGRQLFEAFDLALATSEIVQLFGPNGAGKSSLLRLAAGLLAPAAGMVERPSLALADDKPSLDLELTLAKALRFWTGRDPAEALDALGIGALANLPIRYLSSGQAKRASLARVIASGARLWLLDEPLNALDAEGTALLSKAIARHRGAGGAVLAASHGPLPGDWRVIEVGT